MAKTSNGGDEPMVRAYLCRPSGGATPIDWDDAKRAFADRAHRDPTEGWLWLHVDRADEAANRWLRNKAGLSEELIEALTVDDTRPRATRIDDGALLILRGKNRKAKSARKPMVSLRLFVTPSALLTVRLRPFSPTHQMAARIEAGQVPPSPGAFVGRLVEIMMIELEATLDALDARQERLENFAFSAPSGQLRTRRNDLNRLRRAVMVMKRFMRPQSDALRDFAGYGPDIIPPDEVPGLQEAGHQAGRICDDLEGLMESASLVNDEMQARIADRLNYTMLQLTALSTVFLPLTFATGLLGVNLSGIPFAERGWAFTAFLLLLALIAAAAVVIVQRMRTK